MRTTTTTCDKCREVIEADATTLSAPYGRHRDRLPEPIDLCPGCWSAFTAWLRREPPIDGTGGTSEK